jgi:hypothetical protein
VHGITIVSLKKNQASACTESINPFKYLNYILMLDCFHRHTHSYIWKIIRDGVRCSFKHISKHQISFTVPVLLSEISSEWHCNAVLSGEKPTFRRIILSPTSGSNSKPSKNYLSLPPHCWFLVCLNFKPWRLERYFPPKHQTLSELHSFPMQKTVPFIVSTMRTSNPAIWKGLSTFLI